MQGFNRINSCRSIPTAQRNLQSGKFMESFQSYQFMQINPDLILRLSCQLVLIMFQSYQFMQINPDVLIRLPEGVSELKFQSYQFMQINPDKKLELPAKLFYFPVSIVSIHADQSRRYCAILLSKLVLEFQSYQFMQINPDLNIRSMKL